jgi:iron complex transport system substrate-binding protein
MGGKGIVRVGGGWLLLWLCLLLTLAGSGVVCSPVRAAGAAGDRCVIDAAGRRVEVDKPFTRIISLYGAHTENLFALGLDAEIIGVSPHEVYPAAAQQKPVFSYHDGPEKFLAARPDLILVRPMIERGYPQLLRRLRQSGITVVSLQPHGIDGLYRYWRELGVLCGRRAAARELTERFRREIVLRRRRSQAVAQRPKVYFEAIHRRMKTFAPGALALFCLDCAGGENVAADAVPVRRGSLIAPYGKERILAHADEIEIFLAQRGTMNRVTVDTILKEPGFQVIAAVRKKRVYLVDETIVSRPGPRLLQGIDYLYGVLHPGGSGSGKPNAGMNPATQTGPSARK